MEQRELEPQSKWFGSDSVLEDSGGPYPLLPLGGSPLLLGLLQGLAANSLLAVVLPLLLLLLLGAGAVVPGLADGVVDLLDQRLGLLLVVTGDV